AFHAGHSLSVSASQPGLGKLPAIVVSNMCSPYALPLFGPRKYQRINPTSGSTTTSTIHSAFFSLEAELCAMLMIAQTSPASTSRPHRLLIPISMFLVPFFARRQVYAWASAQSVRNQTFIQ